MIGTTGSGKTSLLQRLISTRHYAIVIDSKHELKWQGFRICRDWGDVDRDIDKPTSHVIYRPPEGEAGRIAIRSLLAKVYRQHNWDIAIDEIYSLGYGHVQSFPQEYTTLLTRGRSRGISVWTCSQRPRAVPLVGFTEATHVFVFELSSKQDRAHVAQMFGVDGLDKPLSDHDFIYYNRVSHQQLTSNLRTIQSAVGGE